MSKSHVSLEQHQCLVCGGLRSNRNRRPRRDDMTKRRIPLHGGKPSALRRADRMDRSMKARRRRDGRFTEQRLPN